ncbi:Chitinase 2 [Chamberlinius hualienensis]
MKMQLLFPAVLATLCLVAVVNSKRIDCYFASWAIYRQGDGKFQPEDIDTDHCTYIIYGFAGLNTATNEIMSLDTWNDLPDGLNSYQRFTGLTSRNPNIVPLLGVGGWNEGSEKYSNMAANEASRTTFINSCVTFLETYGFKGMDFDWEYPTLRGGKPEDKENYVLLLQGLQSALHSRGLQLTVAVGVSSPTFSTTYDVPAIVQAVDFIHLLTFDYHTYLDGYTGHGEPLNPRPEEDQTFGLTYSVNLWLSNGAPASKLSIALAMYGHTFALSDAANTAPHAPTVGAGSPGPFTANAGTLGYSEICLNRWPSVVDSYWAAPYAYSGNQWVSYDDPSSIATKCQLANSLGLGGAWLYSIDTDDFRGSCGTGTYPLLNAYFNDCP